MAKKSKDQGNTANEEAPQGIRPNDLAKELGVDGKRVRAFLRGQFPRQEEARNTNWALTKAQEKAVREKFTAKKAEDKAQAATA